MHSQTQPVVSIIVPCYNEERTIALLLEAINIQNYPITDIEVVIADALSEDDTRGVINRFANKNPDLKIRVVDNSKKTIPAAVNTAANEASGEFLIRIDAHSIPDRDYVRIIVNHLQSGIAENVGGIWEIQPGDKSCIARAIAVAASHPFGAGDAQYRISKKAAYVDTVPFGAFTKQKFLELGGFDESLLSNEDYEFNTRLRMGGGKIWLDPAIKCQYFARPNLKQLAKQYWRYGFWKAKMLRRFPQSIRWRQIVPPLFSALVLILFATSFFIKIALIILFLLLSTYLFILLSAGFLEVIKRKSVCYITMPCAFATIHFSWGCGFLFSFIRGIFKKKNNG
jgi:glycosyltransferase involved in cell wall biosynthesis